MKHHHCGRLGVLPFALAMGITWGLGMMILAWLAWKFNFGIPFIKLFASVYTGYAESFKGGLIGGGWGFVDGFVTGIIMALIYNLCLCMCCKPACCNKPGCCDNTSQAKIGK